MNIDYASPEARDFAETSEEHEAREWQEAAEENGWGGKWQEYREHINNLWKDEQ